ncbi:hypothetical protein [Quadrisphaera setariae]|uniref:Uncharacterized protein n=1 Tax=Quadrisphaera setariae TaxID=2593304 RepID=A0A5C8ZE08_9ACTN|nr:hypothetical protein [Quadrisphaera setariae]TXR55433.1 hypothetical protein FMM08_14015 [Quadrisphaera setariae]
MDGAAPAPQPSTGLCAAALAVVPIGVTVPAASDEADGIRLPSIPFPVAALVAVVHATGLVTAVSAVSAA